MLPSDFLQALFSGCGGLAVCMSHKGTAQGMVSAWFAVEEGMPTALLEEAAKQDAKNRDTYFSVCPARKIPSTNADRCRVRKQDVACIPAYFMDVDTQEDPAKAGKRVPQSIAGAVEALGALPCPPSALVQSGHGVHAYWFLEEPVPPSAAPALRAFANAVAAAMGCLDLDAHASETARILRVPGTTNYKGGGLLPVQLLEGGSGERYPAAVLDAFAAEYAPAASTPEATPEHPSAEPSAYPVDAVSMLGMIRKKDRQGRTRRLLDGDITGYKSQSEADIALCNDLAFWCGRDELLMDGVFRLSGLMREKWDRKQSGSTYGALTIAKAARECPHVYGERTAATPMDYGDEDWTPPKPPDPRFAAYEMAYASAFGYASIHGSLYQIKQDAQGNEIRAPLANFTPLIAVQETLDDGAERSMRYVMQGVSSTGEELPRCTVATSEFDNMRWPGKNWGFTANIFPGTTVRDKLRHACQLASVGHAKRETVYTATGWRDMTGRPFYVSGTGAIGGAAARVELEGGLERYAVEASTDPQAAACASFELLNSYPLRISAPLLGFMYLAPLTAFLDRAQCPPSLTLWMQGRTQSGKSTAAGLFMSHFGPGFCTAKNPPATFHDSPAALHRKAFLVKDAPLLIDDYHPVGSRPERERMTAAAQAMIRGWSNRSERARANSDLSVKAPMPPRGIGLCTGEDVPEVGESGVARLYVLRMTREDKLPQERLQPLMAAGRRGEYAGAMAGYIAYLAVKASELPWELRELWEKLVTQIAQRTPDTGGDLTENAAFLLLGLHMAMAYFISAQAATREEMEALWPQAVEAIITGAANQAADLAEAKPSTLFLGAVRELLATHAAQLRDLTCRTQEYIPPENMVGYQDERMVYLIPGAIYSMARKHLEGRGAFLPIGAPELWRHLRDEKLIQPDKKSNPTRNKSIDGKAQRLLWVHRTSLDVPEE